MIVFVYVMVSARIAGDRVNRFCVAPSLTGVYRSVPMLLEKPIAIPESLHNRLRELARDDEDLFNEDRAKYEKTCLFQHHRRVWEKLSADERALVRKHVSTFGHSEFIAEYMLIDAIAAFFGHESKFRSPDQD